MAFSIYPEETTGIKWDTPEAPDESNIKWDTPGFDDSQAALSHSQMVFDSIFKTPLQNIAEGNAGAGLERSKGAAKEAFSQFASAGAQNAGPVGADMLAHAPAFKQNIDALNTNLQPTNVEQLKGKTDTQMAELALGTTAGKSLLKEIPTLGKFFADREAAKLTRLTVDALKPNLTKKELEEMVASGKGTIGRFGAPEIDFTKDKQFMKAVEASKGVIKGKSAVEDVNLVRDAIGREAEALKGQISALDHPYPIRELAARMSAAEEPISLRGTPFEKQIKPLKQAAVKLAEESGGKISGLLDARKAFDDLVEKTYPNLYDKENAPMRNAVVAIRDAMNQYIEENLPTGVGYRESLQKQRALYNAMENLLTKVHEEHGMTGIGRRLTRFAKDHPYISGAAAFGAAEAGYNKVKQLTGL